MQTATRCLTLALVTLALSACPPTNVNDCDATDDCDTGAPPADVCNSKEEAFADPQCVLALATPKSGYISTLVDGGVDQDWYSVTLPPGLTARSLLHVTGGYSAPQTAVNFQINVLDEAGAKSIVTGVDVHGAGAPKPVDLILPFSQSSAKLLVLVGDQGSGTQVRVDNRNAYQLTVEVKDNPDSNEPNDTTATPITLAASGAVQQGAAEGYLATADDVDQYSFAVAGGGRQIIYLHIGTAAALTNPPLPYRLGYTLYDPTGTPISEGHMENEFLKVDLATARLAKTTGTYTLKVSAYRSPNQTGSIAGDLRVESKYSVDVRVMPDLDVNEPNDTKATARPKTMALGSPLVITGRLATIPDEEWFELDLPANAQTTVLRYAYKAGTGTGRYPPTAAVPNRNIRLVTDVTGGATPQDNQVQCKTSATVCPKGYEADVGKQNLVESLCMSADGPLCLWSERQEHPKFPDTKNLVGAIPVPAHGATAKVYFMFRDTGFGSKLYADDKDYTLTLTWEADPADGPTPVTLGTATNDTVGHLTYGHGRILDPFDMNNGDGIRAPDDYDAVVTDTDAFQFNLPATGDQSWNVSWVLDHLDGGTQPPADVSLELNYCDNSGGSCRTVKRVMAYSGDPLTPWYLPASFSNASILFTRTVGVGATTITAQPTGCWCVPALYAAGGSFGVTVGAVNRVDNAPLTYHLRQSVGTYPQTYVGDAGTTTCPSGADAGCGFGL